MKSPAMRILAIALFAAILLHAAFASTVPTTPPVAKVPANGPKDEYAKWISQHIFRVHYEARYTYDRARGALRITIVLRILDGPKPELIGLKAVYEEFSVEVAKYGGLAEALYKLPAELRLDAVGFATLARTGAFAKDLGARSEILTTADDPPPWWQSYPYLPRYVWKMIVAEDQDQGVIYKAEEPINIVFRMGYNGNKYRLLDYIIDELRDGEARTEDDWPTGNVADNMYIYNYTTNTWDKQDINVYEGDEKVDGCDTGDRIHARLWTITSPRWGYVVVGNVHLEEVSLRYLTHVIIHVGNDYSYGYEYAEIAISYEFNRELTLTPYWWYWDKNRHEWHVSTSKNDGLGDLITSYYVAVEYSWSINRYGVYMSNEKSPDGEKILGDGYAAVITMEANNEEILYARTLYS